VGTAVGMKPDPEVSSRAWKNIGGSAVFFSVNYLVQNVIYKPSLSEALFFILRLGCELQECTFRLLTYRCDIWQKIVRSKQRNT
jgi:hypothetical protein